MAVIDTYTGDLGLTPDDKVLGSSYEGTINGVDRYVTKNYTLGSLAEFFSGFINENGSTINVTELITNIENSFGVVGDGDYSQALYEKIIEVVAEEGYARVTSLESLTATVETNDVFARSNITRIDEVIATETYTRSQAILNLASQFDTDLTSALATINQTFTTYADAEQALAQLSTTLQASFTTDLTAAVATINQTLTTLSTAEQALAQIVTDLDSSFNTDLTSAVAGINQTLTTLTTADQALSQSVTTLESSFEGLNTSVGSVTQTVTSLATDSLNLQSDVTVLRSAFLYGAGGSIQDFDNTLRTKIQDLITSQTGLLPQDADLADVYTSLNNFNTALGFLSSGFQLDAEGRPINILNATLEDNLTAIAQAGVTLGTLGIDLLPEQVDALRSAFDINAQGDIIGLGTTLADSVAVDVQTTLTGAGFAYAADVEQLKTGLGLFDENGNITALSTGLVSQVTNVVTTATGTIISDVDTLRAGFVSYDPVTGEPTGFSDALKSDIGTVIATADLASASSVETLEASLQKIFRQTSAPATTWPLNSIWYDTDDNNKLYILTDVSGTNTWVETSDTSKASVASVNVVQSAVNTAGDRLNGIDGKLESSYAINVDAGGRVAGLKLLANGATGSNFIARADEFGVDMPNGTRVLTVNSGGLNINGSGSFTGAINATSGTFSGTVTGSTISLPTNDSNRRFYVDSQGSTYIKDQAGGTPSLLIQNEAGATRISISGNDINLQPAVASPSTASAVLKWGSVAALYTNTSGQLVIEGPITTNSSGYFAGNLQTAGNLSVSGSITAQGNITAYATSDERLKDNIVPISNAIEKINKIGGYEFDWNNNQEDFTGHDIGVVAQEIKDVMPEIVTERQDGYLAVRYEKIVALLIQGMKEQQLQIEELKNKLDGITR